MEPTQVDTFPLYEPIIQTVEPPLTYVATPRHADDEAMKARIGGGKKKGKGGFVEQVRLVWKGGKKADDKKKKKKADPTKSRPARPMSPVPPAPPPLKPWQNVFKYEYEEEPQYRPSSHPPDPFYKFPIPPPAPYTPYSHYTRHERDDRPIYEVIRPVRDGDSGYAEAPPSPLIEHIRPRRETEARREERKTARSSSFSMPKKPHVRFEEPPERRRNSFSESSRPTVTRINRVPSPEPILRETRPERKSTRTATTVPEESEEVSRLRTRVEGLQCDLNNARARELEQEHVRRLDERIADLKKRLSDEKRKQHEHDGLLRAMRQRQSDGQARDPVIRYPNGRRNSLTDRPSNNVTGNAIRPTRPQSSSNSQQRNSGYFSEAERRDSYRRSDPNLTARQTTQATPRAPTPRAPTPRRPPPNISSRVWDNVAAAEDRARAAEQRAREEADTARRQAERQAAERRHAEMLRSEMQAQEELRRADRRYADEQRRRREMRRNREADRVVHDDESRDGFYR